MAIATWSKIKTWFKNNWKYFLVALFPLFVMFVFLKWFYKGILTTQVENELDRLITEKEDRLNRENEELNEENEELTETNENLETENEELNRENERISNEKEELDPIRRNINERLRIIDEKENEIIEHIAEERSVIERLKKKNG